MPVIASGKPAKKKVSPTLQTIIDCFGFEVAYYPDNGEWIGRLKSGGKPVVCTTSARETVASLVSIQIEANPGRFVKMLRGSENG